MMVKMKWRNYLFWSDQCKLLGLVLWFTCYFGVQVEAQTYCEDKPKILYYHKDQAALVSGLNDEISNHVVISNVNKEFLACVSSRNVEWAYVGEGEPSKFQESSSVDIQKYDDGSISYCLTSQITFYNKQSDTELSKHTGRYICREIGNVSNAASVYLFASRKNSPTFLQSRKTLTLPLSAANITVLPRQNVPKQESNDTLNTSAGNKYTESNNERNSAFIIPCVTTNPDVTVKLLRKNRNHGFKRYTGAPHQFDPKVGFTMSLSKANANDLSEFYGDYKCVSSASNSGGRSIEETKTNNAEDFVLISLVKAKSLKLYPPVSDVYTSGVLNLTCESEEPVIMKEVNAPSAQDVYSYLDEDDYGRDRSDDIVETTEKTEQKSHIANYMELSPAPGRTGEIQCLSEKDGKVLHTWRYRIIRKRAEKLSGIKFNKREKSFTCKSKLGAPGRLSFVSCRTPSECRINRNCLMKSENCRGYSNSSRAFCERKSHFCGKILYSGGSGLIRCMGEGIDEIRGFTDESATDQGVRLGFGKLKASETAFLQLDTSTNEGHQTSKKGTNGVASNPIYEGDRVNVTLRVGYYFFLYPVQWAVKFKNGSTLQINPEYQTLKVERLTRTVLASITLPYTSATIFKASNSASPNENGSVPGGNQEQKSPPPSEIVGLNALIPLRSSVDPSWKTISLPLTVYGKEGLLKPPTESESEELLIQPLYNLDQSAIPRNTSFDVDINADEILNEDEKDNEEEDNEDDEGDEADQEQDGNVADTHLRETPKVQFVNGSNEHNATKDNGKTEPITNSSDVPNQNGSTSTTSPSPVSTPASDGERAFSYSHTSASDKKSENNVGSMYEIVIEEESHVARAGLLGGSESSSHLEILLREGELVKSVEAEPIPTTEDNRDYETTEQPSLRRLRYDAAK